MALTAVSLEFLKDIFDRIDDELPDERRMLSLGYPDLLASPQAIRSRFGLAESIPLKTREDSDSIIRWHQAGAVTDRIVETFDLFEALDFELEIVDVVASRSNEAIVDLNQPVDARFHERYSLVIDPGTCEHCFNIAQAMKNVATMTAGGGYVFHSNPVNMFNHGFYNLNPTWYHDFYAANGFEVLKLLVVHNDLHDPQLIEVPPTSRFRALPENSSNLVVARRREVRDIVWPTQSKYVQNPMLRG